MQTYKDVLKYLNSLTNYERTGFNSSARNEFNLDKIHAVLRRLGGPEESYSSIHIAGTKGKGSVSTFTSAILKEHGYKVGLFTSPHIVDMRERIQINGNMIKKSDMAHVIGHLLPFLRKEEQYTFFEILTLMAILYFKEKAVDFAVFETGLGGRLDATNVVRSKVCGITPISFDHMDILGNSLKKIAREKAAIIKRGSVCVSAMQPKGVTDVIKEKCLKEKVPLVSVGKDILFSLKSISDRGSDIDVHARRGKYNSLHVNMLGNFQPENAAMAVGICEAALGGKKVKFEGTKKALNRAFIPARLEIIKKKPLIVIDGAQNKESARRLKKSVDEIFRCDKVMLILGISRDKDVLGVCKELVPLADKVILTKSGSGRALNPKILLKYVRGMYPEKEILVTDNTKTALKFAVKFADKNDLILVAGSFYVAGEIRLACKGHSAQGTAYRYAPCTMRCAE